MGKKNFLSLNRLDYFLKNYPLKSELGYDKEHTIDINGKTKFSNTGEIAFGKYSFTWNRYLWRSSFSIRKGTPLKVILVDFVTACHL